MRRTKRADHLGRNKVLWVSAPKLRPHIRFSHGRWRVYNWNWPVMDSLGYVKKAQEFCERLNEEKVE
jgi:hypothetical protein